LDTRTVLPRVGTGRKERPVPLWQETARVLNAWCEALGEDTGQIAFPQARGKALSREGGDSLVKHALQRARPAGPCRAPKHITPPVVRHTTARHLLQAGGDVATIALGLGQERLETTHVSL
jgi:integrase/recombinase XerD